MSHIIVIPYHSESEVDRYLKIARQIKSLGAQQCEFRFLLAASPQIRQSDRLYDCFAETAPTSTFSCPTRLVGYPFGATAMFWDSMDFIAENFPADGGFNLWLESDMVPVKPDWLDRLSRDWYDWDQKQPLLLMGCYVSEIYKRRAFSRPRLAVAEHINGGACYARNFATQMPLASRIGDRFDLNLFPFVQQHGGFKHTDQFAFSLVSRLEQDMSCQDVAILHGIMQDKDQFVDSCLAAKPQPLMPQAASLRDQMLDVYHKFELRYFKRGEQFILANLMVQKDSRLNDQTRKTA